MNGNKYEASWQLFLPYRLRYKIYIINILGYVEDIKVYILFICCKQRLATLATFVVISGIVDSTLYAPTNPHTKTQYHEHKRVITSLQLTYRCDDCRSGRRRLSRRSSSQNR